MRGIHSKCVSNFRGIFLTLKSQRFKCQESITSWFNIFFFAISIPCIKTHKCLIVSKLNAIFSLKCSFSLSLIFISACEQTYYIFKKQNIKQKMKCVTSAVVCTRDFSNRQKVNKKMSNISPKLHGSCLLCS